MCKNDSFAGDKPGETWGIKMKRRVRLYGHIIRLPVGTPVRIALTEYAPRRKEIYLGKEHC